MDKSELRKALVDHHALFIQLIASLPAREIQHSHNGKWSPLQQMDHIIRSVDPVRLAFSMPAFLLRIIFGSANRPSKTYDALVEKYKGKLSAGGKSPSRFIPNSTSASLEVLSRKLKQLTDTLSSKVDSFSEEQLDQLILPHPLLGKLTLREMLYFTIYHVQHHQRQVEAQLAGHLV